MSWVEALERSFAVARSTQCQRSARCLQKSAGCAPSYIHLLCKGPQSTLGSSYIYSHYCSNMAWYTKPQELSNNNTIHLIQGYPKHCMRAVSKVLPIPWLLTTNIFKSCFFFLCLWFKFIFVRTWPVHWTLEFPTQAHYPFREPCMRKLSAAFWTRSDLNPVQLLQQTWSLQWQSYIQVTLNGGVCFDNPTCLPPSASTARFDQLQMNWPVREIFNICDFSWPLLPSFGELFFSFLFFFSLTSLFYLE